MVGGGSQWLDHEPAAVVEDKIKQDAAQGANQVNWRC